MRQGDQGFRTFIGLVLRYGVVASFAIVALGSALLFLEGQTGYSQLGSVGSLVGAHTKFVLGPAALLGGAASGKPYALIDVGLVVLLATPVARVVISIFLFAEQRRYAFVAITAIVLTVLLLSIFVVAPLLSR